MTPFIREIDPTGEHHRELGRLAARALFERCPDGCPPAEVVEEVQAAAEAAIRHILEPLGATLDDMRAAVRLTAQTVGPTYFALVYLAKAEVGGRA